MNERDDFHDVYEANVANIYAYCLRRTGSADAQDATAEVFLVLWRRWSDRPVDSEVTPWIYGVARNVLANRNRSARRRVRLWVRLAALRPSEGSEPEDATLIREDYEAVGIAVWAGFLWGSSRPTVEVSAGSTPTELALRYIDARNNGDPAAAMAILGEDAMVAEYPVIRRTSDLRDAFDYLAIVDERVTVLGCDSPIDRPDVVTCTYQMTNRLVRDGSVPGTLMFVVADGRIVVAENAIDIEAYNLQAFGPWFSWLDQQTDGGFMSFYRWVFQLDRSVPTPRYERLDNLNEALDIYAPSG